MTFDIIHAISDIKKVFIICRHLLWFGFGKSVFSEGLWSGGLTSRYMDIESQRVRSLSGKIVKRSTTL